MKKIKKLFSIILVMTMLLTLIPSDVYATGSEPVTEATEEVTTEQQQSGEDATVEVATEEADTEVTEETTETAKEEPVEEVTTETADDEIVIETEEDEYITDDDIDDYATEMGHKKGDVIQMDVVKGSNGKATFIKYITPANALYEKIKKGIDTSYTADAKNGVKAVKGTTYGTGDNSKAQCAEYVYRALVYGGALKSKGSNKSDNITLCNELYSYMKKNGWKVGVSAYAYKDDKKTKLTDKNWENAIKNAVSGDAHEKAMAYINSGDIKPGDVMFFVKEGSTSSNKFGHVAIVTSSLVETGNGHGDTIVMSHASTYESAYSTGNNGKGYLRDTLKNNTYTWKYNSASETEEASAEEGDEQLTDADFVAMEDLDEYIEEMGGAAVTFTTLTPDVDTAVTGYVQIYKKNYTPHLYRTDTATYYDPYGIMYYGEAVSGDGTAIKNVRFELEEEDNNGYFTSEVVKVPLSSDGKTATGKVIFQEDNMPTETGFETDTKTHEISINITVKDGKLTGKGSSESNPIKIGLDVQKDKIGDYAMSSGVRLKKTSSTGRNDDMYSVAGATYELRNFDNDQLATYYMSEDNARTNTNPQTGLLTTDANGYTAPVWVPLGRYYFVEQTPSKGHMKHDCGKTHLVTLESKDYRNVKTVECVEPCAVDPLTIEILKADADTPAASPVALSGAVFEIKFYEGLYPKNGLPANANRTFYVATYTNADGLVNRARLNREQTITEAAKLGYNSDALYDGQGTSKGLPQGTFTIREVKAPEGYEGTPSSIKVGNKEITGTTVWGQRIMNSANTNIDTFIEGENTNGATVTLTITDPAERTDIHFKKIDYDTKEPLESVVFRLTDKTTGESHILVTDSEGNADTASSYVPHSKNTNGYDEKYKDNATLTPKESGIWFKGANSHIVDDNKGALLVGHDYELEELTCPANKGKKQLIRPITFTLTKADTSKNIDLGTITNVGKITLGSTAISEQTNSHVAYPESSVVINDKVDYSFLTAGSTYTLKGILMEVITDSDGKKEVVPAYDDDGNMIRANKTFTVENGFTETEQEKCGSETVTFTFKGTKSKNKTYVAYEYLYSGENTSLIEPVIDADGEFTGMDETGVMLDSAQGSPAKHTDMYDENQTIYFPSISTNAWAADTKTGVTKASENTEITDTVTYKNLIKGKKYTLYTQLKYKDGENEEPADVKMADGKAMECFTTFEADDTDGTVDVKLPAFDATQLIDKTTNEAKPVVVYEVLYDGEVKSADEMAGLVPAAAHTDINDPDQTVFISSIGTTAADKKTMDKNSLAEKEVVIVDTVHYSGLLPHKEYTVSGTLKDKETGNTLTDANGNEVTASITFTPDESSGDVDIEFKFDGSLLAGKTAVAFENISYQNVSIATHADLEDVAQTIYFPEIKTSLADGETKSKNTFVDDDVTLIDTVSYTNLIAGYKYTVSGYLMDKDTNQPILIDGEKITGSTTFTAGGDDAKKTDEAGNKTYKIVSGTADVTYKFDGTKAGLKKENGGPVYIVCFEKLEIAQDYAEQGHYEEVKKEAYDEKTYETHIICDQCGMDLTGLSDEELTAHTDAHGSFTETVVEGEPIHHEESMEKEYVKDADAYTGNVVIALHEDINDIDQTVSTSTGRTVVKGKDSKENVCLPDEEIEFVDTVYFSGLETGKEYKMVGTLYKVPDQIDETVVPEKLLIDGKEVTAETVFTPAASNGAVDVVFKLNASALKGQSVVIFEDCYHNGVKVFAHGSLDDENETVHFPKIGTKAADKKGNKKISETEVTLVDTISYTNLKPGIKYVAKGKVMDAKTGKQIKVNGKAVTAKKEFTPDKADGTVEVTFKFSTKGLEGHKLVVFEDVRVYSTDVSIGKHEDLTDEDQTVIITEKTHPPKTGQIPMAVLIFLLSMGIGLAFGMTIRKKKDMLGA